MAFTVGGDLEDTSYVSVAYADSYFVDRDVTSWFGADSLKKGALARASDYVKALFTPRFDPDKVDPDALPDTLQQAVSLYALVELQTPGGLAPIPLDSAATVVTKEKVGPIETTYEVVGSTEYLNTGIRRRFPIADALIAQLLLPSYGLTRVIR